MFSPCESVSGSQSRSAASSAASIVLWAASQVAHEEWSRAELRRDRGEPLVRLALGEHGVGALEPFERALGLVELPFGVPEHGLDERRFPRRAGACVQLLRALQLAPRRLHVSAAVGGASGPVPQPRLLERVVGQLGGLREDAGGLDRRGQRRCALARAGERLPRLRLSSAASSASGSNR